MKNPLTIVIFGASGKVGRLLVQYALENGYHVIAFVHRAKNLEKNPKLTMIEGDIYRPEDVRKALKHADIVLSALGSWGTRRKDVLSAAMTNIIPAMKQEKISRIISLTGAEARARGDELGFIHTIAHFFIGIVAGKILHDGEKHIELLEKSGLDWTVIRSPIMRSGTNSTHKLSRKRPLPWQTINRTAVARAMMEQVSEGASQSALFVK